MSVCSSPDDDLHGVGSRMHQNSFGSTGSDVEQGDQSARRASSSNDARGRGGDEGIIPANSMAIVPTHPNMDVKLFESIVVCDPQNFTDEEKEMTNEEIVSLSRDPARSLCKRCKYRYLTNRGAFATKSVSTNGGLPQMTSRLLAYFQVLRQQSRLGTARNRPFSLNPTKFTPAEDARLLEILLDKDYEAVVNAIFESSPRPVLDISDGSPKVAVWTNVVASLFNNFSRYCPEHRFDNENEALLCHCDPNNQDIPRRIPDHLRGRFTALRSRWTIVYGRGWLESGGNDPETFVNFINLSSPLDISMLWMFRVLHNGGYDTFLHRCSRTFNQESQIDSGNMQDALERISGRTQHGTDTSTDTHPRRSALVDLSNDLQKMVELMEGDRKEEEEDRKIAHLSVIQSNRDRAAVVMDQLEEKIRKEEPATSKRKRLQKLFRRRKREWIELEKQVSELTDMSFDEDDFDGDESFLID